MKTTALREALRDFGLIRPCVGCGYCCIQAQCIESLFVHGYKDSCPELYWNGTMYRCSLMEKPAPEGPEIKLSLGSGQGCGSPLNTWRDEVKYRIPK